MTDFIALVVWVLSAGLGVEAPTCAVPTFGDDNLCVLPLPPPDADAEEEDDDAGEPVQAQKKAASKSIYVTISNGF